MRIGFVPLLQLDSGGVYQYSLTMLQALRDLKEGGLDDQIVLFTNNRDHPVLGSVQKAGWDVKPLEAPTLKRRLMGCAEWLAARNSRASAALGLLKEARKRQAGRVGPPSDPDAVKANPKMRRWLQANGVDFMVFPVPMSIAFESGVPYVMAIHDLQHRLQPHFDEVSADGEWEKREYLFRNAVRHAALTLTDSDIGKEDVINAYGSWGFDADRIKVLPFLPASYLIGAVTDGDRHRIRSRYRLAQRFLFYPAQFWPHKNHARIVQALDLIRRRHGERVQFVFCGSHDNPIRERTFKDVMDLVDRLGLGDQVRYLGLVPDEDMSGLYAEAEALIMPTFFGPTNIPVLEAWALGCPVLTSDIRGIREQAGDAAVLADPSSVEAIAEGMYDLWTDAALRATMKERGKERLETYTQHDFTSALKAIIEEAKTLVAAMRP